MGNDDQEKNSAASSLSDNDCTQLISLIHDNLESQSTSGKDL